MTKITVERLTPWSLALDLAQHNGKGGTWEGTVVGMEAEDASCQT